MTWFNNFERWVRDRTGGLASERGEGVISAAIAILVIAFLGVAMWVAFDVIMDGATTTIGEQVDQIGGGS